MLGSAYGVVGEAERHAQVHTLVLTATDDATPSGHTSQDQSHGIRGTIGRGGERDLGRLGFRLPRGDQGDDVINPLLLRLGPGLGFLLLAWWFGCLGHGSFS